jgi:hypothetical protein
MSFPLPRFEAVSRRHFLALGGLTVVTLAGCSNNDKKTFGGASTSPGSGTSPGTPSTTSGGGATSTTTKTSTPVVTRPAGPALPAGAKVNISFTFQPQDQGFQVRNPYIAVWVEDTAGNIVRNLAIWYRPSEARYIDHLSRWYNAESTLLNGGGTDDTASAAGATRAPGQFQLTWDCTDMNKKSVGQGDFVIAIEAAREHGPYGLMTGKLTLGTAAASVKLADNGELSAASVAYVV